MYTTLSANNGKPDLILTNLHKILFTHHLQISVKRTLSTIYSP